MSDTDKPTASAPDWKSMPVTFRLVEAGDESFLRKVYDSTRMDELAQVPWNEAQREAFLNMQFTAQQQHYRTNYPEARHEIILLDDQPVGRVYIDREDGKINILDITILPEYRNAGIGTRILNDLQQEAAHRSMPVIIYVETFNPSLRLFERLGFSQIKEEGIHFLLEWRPTA